MTTLGKLGQLLVRILVALLAAVQLLLYYHLFLLLFLVHYCFTSFLVEFTVFACYLLIGVFTLFFGHYCFYALFFTFSLLCTAIQMMVKIGEIFLTKTSTINVWCVFSKDYLKAILLHYASLLKYFLACTMETLL